ncbi:12757_t:CDS:2 [Entrophospora sp. SA101]|nr:12757_t:CDS:2 [Entrophospora sp. SA101]
MSQNICIKPKRLPARYIIQEGNLLEVQCIGCEDQKSWFIDNNIVQKDGRLFIFTSIDPLFILLPILDNCRRKNIEFQGLFLSPDAIFDHDEFPSVRKLSSINNIYIYMNWICDSQEVRLKTVLEIIMEYLPYNWANQLKIEYKYDELCKLEGQDVVYVKDIPINYVKKQGIENKQPESVKKRKLTTGVTSLAKVNTRGMKKMTDFFKKPKN